MLVLKLVFFFFFSCLVSSDAKVCYVKYGQLFNVSCNTDKPNVDTLVWRLTSQYEYIGDTYILFQCNSTGCISDNSSKLPLNATVYLDSTNDHIVSSSLTGELFNFTKDPFSLISDLICETPSSTFLICETIEIYKDPENVTCSPSQIDVSTFTINCEIYPSGRIDKIIVNNKTYLFNNDRLGACSQIKFQNGQAYSHCFMYLDFEVLVPGDNYIGFIASSLSEHSNVTINSNNFTISIVDSPQEITCHQPAFDKYGKSLIIDCVTPLPYKGSFSLNMKTNGTTITSPNVGRIDSSVLSNGSNTFLVKCIYNVQDYYLDVGQFEFQAVLSTRNANGKLITSYSNWTTPINFYEATEIKFTVNGNTDGIVADIGTNVTFQCTVDGFPPSHLDLWQDQMWYSGQSLASFSGNNLSLPVIGCHDAGYYICKSEGNWILKGHGIDKAVFVKTRCSLRLRSDRTSNRNIIDVGTFFKKSYVKIEVIGHPRPTSMKLYKSQDAVKSPVTEGVNIVYSEDRGPYGNIEITFKNTQLIRKIEHFILDVDNGVGTTKFDFSIEADSAQSLIRKTSISLCFLYIISRLLI